MTEPTMEQLIDDQLNEATKSDPVVDALVEWMREADLYRDGRRTQRGVNLVGNEVIAKPYAHMIAEHLAEHGPDLGLLTDFLLDPERAGKHVRAYAFAPQIAEGIVHMLDQEGLL
ncbi:hypothetical protein G4X40_19845 [Rhodococcus sp. D2-41]|uniref:hypothetical protein n=1 Tax=Speluncibacter jeojiensis TaxID=2710754 RepID=UPI00240F0C3B|nr:hypothetical protein [Rhodococcus sp. D2-41]MDG3012397.1 hypothetical protein [Rhodococcus sp. D2-41]